MTSKPHRRTAPGSDHIDSPPSTGSPMPLRYVDSSDARKPAAAHISLGAPNRPRGMDASIAAQRSAGMLSTIRVPAFGQRALTVTPNRASSLAAVLVNPMIPAFAVA